jgi:hypothetical protein
MKRWIVKITLAIVLIFGLSGLSLAQKPTEKAKESKTGPVITTTTKEVQGEVNFINNVFIAITYAHDKNGSCDIGFPLDKNVKPVHKQSLNQIGVGDTVSLEYEETAEQVGKEIMVQRKLKKIYFIRAGVKQPEVVEPEPAAPTEE